MNTEPFKQVEQELLFVQVLIKLVQQAGAGGEKDCFRVGTYAKIMSGMKGIEEELTKEMEVIKVGCCSLQ